MIKNVPEPMTFPVHGVSPDPEFYRMIRETNLGGWPPASKFHDIPYPFGSLPGYLTSAGVIPPVNDDVIHGYIWSVEHKKYIIHAAVPGGRKDNNVKKVSAAVKKKKFKRRK